MDTRSVQYCVVSLKISTLCRMSKACNQSQLVWARNGRRFRMIDTIYRQIKLVIMLLHFAIVLCGSVGQYSLLWQALRSVIAGCSGLTPVSSVALAAQQSKH